MTDLTLNDGRTMPQLGMGTYQIPDAQAATIVRQGIDAGFRLVDTAAIYDNERGVGEGVKATDVFLTTKLWNDRQGDPRAALDESLALLGVDAVDLYLIHWPVPTADRYVDAWKSLVSLRDAGLTRSIGVSNFLPEHLDRIIEATGVTPAVNQIELHPRFQRREEVAYHQAAGIVTQSWSPIGQGKSLLTDPVIEKIAGKHARSPAQVVIAWHLAKGYSVIPKASSHDHLTDNLAAQDLTLDDEDMVALDGMDCGERLGPDPKTFG
ncbi:2,5-diketo-D-gluconate reductase A [Sphingomonas jinjuensis]|uniref:2,5-diketo-D-gluconate reductase A n=1 Tax=Sphingomonas jinjuensis TaxID=535907 RepID=A0A840FLL6_9SPHN|nr:aldo/keto reductase [Sphingomonas jinjuensis]MBB4154818.1 2,5-diketo-D-gluconate reductase A [Sphingomonas jinjuensis]